MTESAERRALRELVASLEELAFRSLCHQLVEQLLWCSGASDFAPGGPAAEGWAKGPRKVLEEYERVCREQR